jgi:hypothetical protein
VIHYRHRLRPPDAEANRKSGRKHPGRQSATSRHLPRVEKIDCLHRRSNACVEVVVARRPKVLIGYEESEQLRSRTNEVFCAGYQAREARLQGGARSAAWRRHPLPPRIIEKSLV